MKELWNKISSLGLDGDEHIQVAKRVRLTNQVAATFSIIAFGYIFMFYYLGFPFQALQVILIVGLLLLALAFNKAKRHTLAKYWFLAIINGAVLLFAFYFGRKSGIQLVFFGVFCLSWLFFEVRYPLQLATGVLFTIISYYTFASGSGEPILAVTHEGQHTLYLSLIGGTFLALGVSLSFLTYQGYKAEHTLEGANDELKSKQEELEQQQEELKQINEELSVQTESLKASEEELRVQEEELRQINAELEERTEAVELAKRALMRKADELELTSKYKSEFLANMSHELRTPLNSVLILANLLKENKTNNLTEKQTEYARIIHKSGTDLLNLINDILDLSKIEAGKIDFNFEDVRVADLGRDMEELFKVLANEKEIQLQIDIDKKVPERIKTDIQRLEQIIKNLMSNAFKFTPKGGQITLSFSMRSNEIAIAVKDTGIGIPEEKQQLIFEAFQQADGSTNRKYGGTGLGLSISKELIRRLGGVITLESNPGAGSTFILYLPLTPHESLMTRSETAEPRYTLPIYDSVDEQQIISDDKERIKTGEQPVLIIEDDAQFASVLQDFSHEKGYKTIVALKGDEGLYYARKYNPVAIILDLGLPIIDGRSILKILKSEETLKHIPIHVVSAEDQSNISSGHIENYFRKPLQINDLEKAFASIEETKRATYNNILILSDQNEINKKSLESLTAERHIQVAYDNVKNLEEALSMLETKTYDCIVVDIDSGISKGIQTLQKLREQAGKETYIMVYLDTDISTSEEMQLRKYAASIVRKSSSAIDRIMDELELFLHKIKNTNPITIPTQYNTVKDSSLQGRTVLLADDDMRNIFALSALLEEQGVQIITAENGKDAIAQLEANPRIELVLMDIMMPEMDGYEAMKRIRAQQQHKTLPIIALTAKAMSGDREKCIEAGASDYITKPVDNNKLFSLMRVWLS